MHKYFFILVSAMMLTACGGNENEPLDTEIAEPEKGSNGSLETYAKRHIEAQLQILGTENYGLKIYKANLDGDDKMDAIITVNRYENALKTAAQSANPSKQAEIGFMGNHNFFFFYDGSLDLISPPIVAPSSPMLPLEIHFEDITSTQYKDILVTYRVRNSAYKAFFTVTNHSPVRYFEWPLFENLGQANCKANGFQYLSTASNPRKNILIYEALVTLGDTVSNFNIAIPTLKNTGKKRYEFFYLPAKQTYVTQK